MQIIFDKKFSTNFQNIFEYIAQDKFLAAKKFKKELFAIIAALPSSPYRYRASFYFEDDSIRDLIYKGYTIPYKITDTTIIILNIFKKNKR